MDCRRTKLGCRLSLTGGVLVASPDFLQRAERPFQGPWVTVPLGANLLKLGQVGNSDLLLGFVLRAGHIQVVHFPTLQRGTGAGNMVAPKGTTERYDRKAGFGPNCVTLMSALVALSLEQQFLIVKYVKMDCAQNQVKISRRES
jgi:hypothetical protein